MSRCAIVVTDRQLLPITSGNRLRILGVIAALRSLGWKVVLVGVAGVAPREQLRSLVDGFVCVDAAAFSGGDLARFDPRPFRRAVDRLARSLKPALVVAEYVWLAPALSRLPRFVRRIVDCHDLFHERTQRFAAAGLHPWARCTLDEELRRLSIGDVILATQEREAERLRDLLPHKRVACILTPIELPAGYAPTHSGRLVVLTVGANHPGNDAVLEFARNAWPRVVERVPAAILQVVGGISLSLAPLPGVENIGQVVDLRDHYTSAAVVVCPVTIGTGVKTKMLEALRFGKATVVTTAATEGMPRPARPTWLVATTLEQSADLVADLLGNPQQRAVLETAAFEFGERHLAQAAFRGQIEAVLPDLLARSLAQLLA